MQQDGDEEGQSDSVSLLKPAGEEQQYHWLHRSYYSF